MENNENNQSTEYWIERRNRGDKSTMSLSSQVGLVLTVLTLIWAGGAAYQRMVYLENQVETLKQETSRASELTSLESEMRSNVRELELRLESELKLERAFSRSICVALSHTQQASGVPVTNDCDRP